jgi:hypothetical protein
MILDDIENVVEKIEELDSKAFELLESNDGLELRINSIEALLRGAL